MRAFFDEIANGACPDIDECVLRLGDHLPLLRCFRNTPQDPQWHAEGDVHIHTGMVLSEAYELLQGPASYLDKDRRLQLVLGALLHDIAKPICTREQELKGVVRTVARGHEAQGRSYLAPRLIGHGLSYEAVESVLSVVGYHHEPKFLVVRDRASSAYKRVCRKADPELLYWVELADMRGRTCQDRKTGIEHIELYRLFAEEYGAFSRGGAHAVEWSQRLHELMHGHSEAAKDLVVANAQRSLENGDILSIEEALARSFGDRGDFSDLVVMVGASGSGKTTFIERHLQSHDVVSLDDIRETVGSKRSDQSSNSRVLAHAREEMKVSLRAKRAVVWDATNLRKDFRSRVAGLGFDYHALVTLIVFHCDLQTSTMRNRGRDHAVAQSVLDRQIEGTEWPELDEAHRVIYVDKDHRVLGAYGVGGALPYGLSWSSEA